MARKRVTVDCWRFYVNYGYGDGWEHECTEFTRTGMRENRKTYLEALRGKGTLNIGKGRERIADLAPGEYERIQADLAAEREALRIKRQARQRVG